MGSQNWYTGKGHIDSEIRGGYTCANVKKLSRNDEDVLSQEHNPNTTYRFGVI